MNDKLINKLLHQIGANDLLRGNFMVTAGEFTAQHIPRVIDIIIKHFKHILIAVCNVISSGLMN